MSSEVKKIISIGFGFLFLGGILTPAFAMTMTTAQDASSPAMVKEMKQDEMQTMKQDKIAIRTGTLQSRADQEITRRLTSLQGLLTKISNLKKLSADQKSTLTTQVQTEINSLTALKTKIAADTDPTALKTDVQSIVGSYRVYLLFIPKVNILSAADRINTLSDQFTTLFDKLQARITEQKGKGMDVSKTQAALDSAKEKISAAKTQAQNAITAVTPLTPDGYPGNKTTLVNARSMIKSAVDDLMSARQDIKTVIDSLKTNKKDSMQSGNATPSATSPSEVMTP